MSVIICGGCNVKECERFEKKYKKIAKIINRIIISTKT